MCVLLKWTTKEVDPRWPFLVATGTLVATVIGLALAERRGALAAGAGAAAAEERPAQPSSPATTAGFFAAAGLLAIGLQIHTNINTTPLYNQFAPESALPWLLPVFSVGTGLLAFAGARASKRVGAFATLTWAAFLGAVLCAAAAAMPGLLPLTVVQFLAGGAWGAINAVLVAHALELGKPGREGEMAGRLTALLAVAALLRLGLVNLQIPPIPAFAAVLSWLPPVCWAAAAILLWRAGTVRRGG